MASTCDNDYKTVDKRIHGLNKEESYIGNDTTVDRHESKNCSRVDNRKDKLI